jgi:hypothetical protein
MSTPLSRGLSFAPFDWAGAIQNLAGAAMMFLQWRPAQRQELGG